MTRFKTHLIVITLLSIGYLAGMYRATAHKTSECAGQPVAVHLHGMDLTCTYLRPLRQDTVRKEM